MRKKILLTILLSIISTTLLSHKWDLIETKNKDKTIYIDKDSIDKKNNLTSFILLHSYKYKINSISDFDEKEQKKAAKRINKKWQAAKIFYVFNCKEALWHADKIEYFYKEKAVGNMIHSSKGNPKDWFPISSKYLGEVFKYICQ